MLNEAIVSWRQKEEEKKKKPRQWPCSLLQPWGTFCSMMRYIQASRHLRSSDKNLAPNEDKLPASRSSTLISQTPLHCRKHQAFKERDASRGTGLLLSDWSYFLFIQFNSSQMAVQASEAPADPLRCRGCRKAISPCSPTPAAIQTYSAVTRLIIKALSGS